MKADYGIDAPGVIRNLAIGGVVTLGLALAPSIRIGPVIFAHEGWWWAAISMLGMALLMLYYSRFRKLQHRDRMLREIAWRGDEQVLDVGTGRGLLLIGAAKRLTTGHAVGIDIWQQEDLSGNSREATMRNIQAEGVEARCELRDEPAQKMTAADETFDVVVSNYCLHNIYDKGERLKALDEIVRVVKPGGKVVITDMRYMDEYAARFWASGMQVRIGGWFPWLRVLAANKK